MLTLSGLLLVGWSLAADHNDPNSVNSIFSDIRVNAADLYDLFGFPSPDATGGERVVVALTFASVPRAGVFDTDMLYRLRFYATERVQRVARDDHDLEGMLAALKTLKAKYLHPRPAEVRVVADGTGRARIDFVDFVGGTLSRTVDMNRPVTIDAPGGRTLKVFIGGRDDAFFNDLPGFFRSINYAPQFYHVPLGAPTDRRELPIPKTLIELDGNRLFNFNPAKPRLGQGVKEDLPPGPLTWSGKEFFKDANGNFRFVYSGRDAQAGMNVNTVIVELPLAFITQKPQTERIVNVWGESWVLKASHKIATIPDDRRSFLQRVWGWVKWPFAPTPSPLAAELDKYKLVDTDGQPFADAALNEREDDRQLGADNFALGPHFVTRLDHLGWGFGPSISALGLSTSFDHGGAKVSVHRPGGSPLDAFKRVKKVLFQELNMPDDSWNPKRLPIPLRRAIDIFVPNVCAIDMDTTGTWPFGRRLEDQVATRFLSMFLDMQARIGDRKYHLDMLGDQALWNQVKIEPKTPPNPLKNDKPFLTQFPYLADPW